jgi:MraZ protein
MFRGTFEHAIDDKGRLSIPAKFRDALTSVFTPPLYLTFCLDTTSLVAYPSDEWRELEVKINAMPAFDPVAQRFRRAFYAPAQECPLDRSGRLLVPPTLRKYAGLERDVVLAGMGKKFELWDKDSYHAMIGEVMEDPAEIAAAMGGLGL